MYSYFRFGALIRPERHITPPSGGGRLLTYINSLDVQLPETSPRTTNGTSTYGSLPPYLRTAVICGTNTSFSNTFIVYNDISNLSLKTVWWCYLESELVEFKREDEKTRSCHSSDPSRTGGIDSTYWKGRNRFPITWRSIWYKVSSTCLVVHITRFAIFMCYTRYNLTDQALSKSEPLNLDSKIDSIDETNNESLCSNLSLDQINEYMTLHFWIHVSLLFGGVKQSVAKPSLFERHPHERRATLNCLHPKHENRPMTYWYWRFFVAQKAISNPPTKAQSLAVYLKYLHWIRFRFDRMFETKVMAQRISIMTTWYSSGR